MSLDRLTSPGKESIPAILRAALRAADPVEAVRAHVRLEGETLYVASRHYDLARTGRIIVIGAGKATAPMASVLAEILGPRISGGLVNVKYGHTAGATGTDVHVGRAASMPARSERARTGPIEVVEAGHPVPDASGQAGAARMVKMVEGLGERDLVIVLISGGGSSLLPLPVSGISLQDLQQLTDILLRSGATITEVNAVRKHCSRVQGGQLARLAAPAQVVALILSDVVGSPLDAIASGPTVPDGSSFVDALAVLRRYAVLDHIPGSVRAHLERGAAGSVPDTPKPGDRLFENVNNVTVGDNAIAGSAAVAEARRMNWDAMLLTTYVQGEAREVGRVMAGLALGLAAGQPGLARPACLVLGGETTVTLRGRGTGGRNQELALSAAIALDESGPAGHGHQIAVASLATDGNDGPTSAAGGLVTANTIAAGRAMGLDAYASLAANDSYTYLDAVESLVVTGPTNTNVNDLLFVFVW